MSSRGLVSIHEVRGSLAGSGVLIGDRLVLTCAHVVNQALGRSPATAARPQASAVVEVRFADVPDSPRKAVLSPEPNSWIPPPADEAKGADVCLLHLTSPQPQGALIAQLDPSPFKSEVEVRASGYPSDWNQKVRKPQLDIASGKIMGPDGYLWLLRADIASIILSSGRKKGRGAGLIYSGFSGGPVYADGKVVGIVAQTREEPTEATAYIIPAINLPVEIRNVTNSAEKKRRSNSTNKFAGRVPTTPSDYESDRFRFKGLEASDRAKHLTDAQRSLQHLAQLLIRGVHDQALVAVLHFALDIPPLFASLLKEGRECVSTRDDFPSNEIWILDGANWPPTYDLESDATLFLIDAAALLRRCRHADQLANELKEFGSNATSCGHQILVGLQRTDLLQPAFRAWIESLQTWVEADELFPRLDFHLPFDGRVLPTGQAEVATILAALLTSNSYALRAAIRKFISMNDHDLSSVEPTYYLWRLARELANHGFIEPAYRVEAWCKLRGTSLIELAGDYSAIASSLTFGRAGAPATALHGIVERLTDAPRVADRLILSGDPGAGKTITLTQIEREWAIPQARLSGKQGRSWLPIRIDLRDFTSGDFAIWLRRQFQAAAQIGQGEERRELVAHGWLARHGGTTEKLWGYFSSPVLYLIDGWSECPDGQRQKVEQWLEMVHSDAPESGLIFAVRRGEEPRLRSWFKQWFETEHQIRILPLDVKLIKRFIADEREDLQDEILESLGEPAVPSSELVRNPFFLRCLIEILGHEGRDGRTILELNLYSILDAFVRLKLPSEADDDAATLVGEFLPQLAVSRKFRYEKPEIDPPFVERARQCGLLSLTELAFRHRILEDYFAARWFILRLRDKRDIEELFPDPLATVPSRLETQWGSLLRMICGSPLSSAIRESILAHVVNQKGETQGTRAGELLALQCAKELAPGEAASSPSTQRALREVVRRIEAGWNGNPSYDDALALGKLDPRLAMNNATPMTKVGDVCIGLFPVTNLEFSRFIQAGGYSNLEYWCEAGRAWLKETKSGKPAFWMNPSLQQPNFPVVGVCFYEALAYASWVGTHMDNGGVCDLPSNSEWSAAAALPAFHDDSGVTSVVWTLDFKLVETLIAKHREAICYSAPRPIGLFPPTNAGLLDVFGNVWEWCNDWFDSRAEHRPSVANFASTSPVLVKGGPVPESADARVLLSILGGGLDPTSRVNNVGFRIVIRPNRISNA